MKTMLASLLALIIMACVSVNPARGESAPGGTALSIINTAEAPDHPRMQHALSMLRREYPDVGVAFSEVYDMRVPAAAMLQGDPSIDIVAVQEYGGLCSRTLYAAGALYDLYAFQDIRAQMAAWIDIDGMFGMDGGLFGVPQAVYPYVWRANAPLFEALQIPLPRADWTWQDFFSLCQAVGEINARQGTQYAVLADRSFPYILNQYNMNHIDIGRQIAAFDTPAFAWLMDSWRAAQDMGVLLLSDDAIHLDPMPDHALLQVMQGQYDMLHDTPLVLPPRLDAADRFPAVTIALVLNRHSQNAEIAARFLSHYASPDALRAAGIENTGLLLREQAPPEYGQADISPEAAVQQPDLYWLYLMEHGTQEFFDGPIIRSQMMDLYPRFMRGEVTAAQFARLMQQVADEAFAQ